MCLLLLFIKITGEGVLDTMTHGMAFTAHPAQGHFVAETEIETETETTESGLVLRLVHSARAAAALAKTDVVRLMNSNWCKYIFPSSFYMLFFSSLYW